MSYYFTIQHPVIQKAISDLQKLLFDLMDNIKEVKLFGSTLKIPIEEAKDIDFLVDYAGDSFNHLKKQIESINIGRRVIVQNMEMGYANCPTWEKTDPLTLHILLYQKGKSMLSKKAIETEKYAQNITNSIFQD